MSIDNEPSSTRVFVSGLPNAFTQQQLRDHFARKFKVTDAHCFPERRIGFVGFQDHESAKDAAKYFNRSFVRMSKISVEIARPIEIQGNAKGQAAPVSRHNLKRQVDTSNGQDVPRKRRRDETDASNNATKRRDHQHQDPPGETISEEPPADTSKSNESPETVDREESQATREAPAKNVTTDNDWLRTRTNRVLDFEDPDKVISKTSHSEAETTPAIQPTSRTETEPEDSEEKSLSPSPEDQNAYDKVTNGRLFVRNLAFDVTEVDLRKLLSSFGKVDEVHVVKDRTSKSKGIAFAQYFEPTDADQALQSLDGQSFHGRLLHCLPASDRKDKRLTDTEIAQLPLKQQQALKRKSEATSSFNWNSLYMNPDAVLASVAQRLNVSKSDLLDPSSSGAAVKQAQAETSIIQETKDYLRSNGVNLEALKQRRRDDRSILLKNFPYGTTADEITSLLSKYGAVDKMIFPPTGTIAIATFEESYAAAAAMKGLAYANLKGSVLYLEQAPSGIFDAKPTEAQAPTAENPGQSKDAAEVANGVGAGVTSTVFVRNLNFSTNSARLAEVFTPLEGFLTARVKTRTDPTRPGQVLSMGFGFVEFQTGKQAAAAVTTLNGHRVDGHEILVQSARKSVDAAEERRKEDASAANGGEKTKVIIKNLPFEASKKDVKTLFGGYGKLRSVRMPKKYDNSARGFAFADFVTSKEAKNAIEALSNTHLLGRKLVLDFAEGNVEDPEEVIKAMEKKAGRQEHLTNVNKMMTGSTRKKFNVDARDDLE